MNFERDAEVIKARSSKVSGSKSDRNTNRDSHNLQERDGAQFEKEIIDEVNSSILRQNLDTSPLNFVNSKYTQRTKKMIRKNQLMIRRSVDALGNDLFILDKILNTNESYEVDCLKIVHGVRGDPEVGRPRRPFNFTVTIGAATISFEGPAVLIFECCVVSQFGILRTKMGQLSRNGQIVCFESENLFDPRFDSCPDDESFQTLEDYKYYLVLVSDGDREVAYKEFLTLYKSSITNSGFRSILGNHFSRPNWVKDDSLMTAEERRTFEAVRTENPFITHIYKDFSKFNVYKNQLKYVILETQELKAKILELERRNQEYAKRDEDFKKLVFDLMQDIRHGRAIIPKDKEEQILSIVSSDHDPLKKRSN